MYRVITFAGCIALAGCTELIHADFGNAAYVVGSTPAGGLSGSPAGDAVSTLGTVTVTNGNGTGLGKHVHLAADLGDEASIAFLPDPAPQGEHFLLSFRGTKLESDPAVTWIEIYGMSALFEEVRIGTIGVAGSPTVDPYFWGAISSEYGISLYDEHMVWDEPHSVYVRLDNVTRRMFLEVVTELPNGTIIQDAGESPYEAEFVRISRVVVRAAAEKSEYGTDYHLGDLNLSTWTDRQQRDGVDLARHYGLIPRPSGSDTRTTLADELILLEEAFAASPSMLRSWLTPTAVRVIEAIRPGAARTQ